MIVWINNPFDNLPGEGGRPHRYMLLARALVAAGHEVVFWSSDFSHPLKAKRQLEPVECGYRVIMVPTLPYKKNVCWARIRSHRKFATQWEQMAVAMVEQGELALPDLLIVSAPPLSTGRRSLELRQRLGYKLVVDIQDAWPETFYRVLPLPSWLREFVGRILFWHQHQSARQIYQGADWVTGVARSYMELAERYGAERLSPKPFFLGTEMPKYNLVRHKEGSRNLNLVYVGILGEMHDLGTVIAGVGASNGVQLHIAGAGPDEERLQRLAAQCQARVVFHGYLGAQALEELLQGMDVGVLPMLADSFVAVPNKLIDYVARGLPVISSLQGEAAELLEQYEAGVMYQAGCKASFQQGLSRLMESAELCVRLGEGARRLAEQQFDAQHIYHNFVRELEGVADGLVE